ncbi:hypothetical protein [Mesorhizobium neociceri]|uniref:Uncharacterized protein n=1 Tax=Mesorhizobium neociceri TaxID=1307853 RepID=A0A838BG95_9HYPH|nr:hypothetical protein [Mesorhizobium neociceri]MBA1145159.1 hypothetical protein [Mesorhizobium neociceri]
MQIRHIDRGFASRRIPQRDQDTAGSKAAQPLTRQSATDALDSDIDTLPAVNDDLGRVTIQALGRVTVDAETVHLIRKFRRSKRTTPLRDKVE